MFRARAVWAQERALARRAVLMCAMLLRVSDGAGPTGRSGTDAPGPDPQAQFDNDPPTEALAEGEFQYRTPYIPLRSYALARRCLVLTYTQVGRGGRERGRGRGGGGRGHRSVAAYACATRCPVLTLRSCLCLRYAMPGTDAAYAARPAPRGMPGT
eukprot:232065-Rhodomonas_salina.1